MRPVFTYNATIVKIVDGDTFDVLADVGFNMRAQLRLRLFGVDTPEVNTVEGRAVRDGLRGMLPPGSPVVIKTFKDPSDKYGRWLAIVYDTRSNMEINQWLIDTKQAVPYSGAKKEELPT